MSNYQNSANDWESAVATLSWQVECGVSETITDTPIDRYKLSNQPPDIFAQIKENAAKDSAVSGNKEPKTNHSAKVISHKTADTGKNTAHKIASLTDTGPTDIISPIQIATQMASQCQSLDDLRQAVLSYEHCEIKKGARHSVFSDGNPKARILILGEAPGHDEDIEGRPFVGRAGQLLDKMFAAIGLSRLSDRAQTALYITNVMPWRPPGNREPTPEEIAMMQPFLHRHILLANPEIIVVMGNTPLFALTGQKGILRQRGKWQEALGKPLMAMTHPAYLLRSPLAKREAWDDLLQIKQQLQKTSCSIT